VNPYDKLTPAQRHKRLRRGDHHEYELYLSSRPWRALRARLIAARGACERCGRDYLVVLQLHHHNYQRLGRELDSDLQVLCAPCHEQADRQRRAA
jgi:hypothetical protein